MEEAAVDGLERVHFVEQKHTASGNVFGRVVAGRQLQPARALHAADGQLAPQAGLVHVVDGEEAQYV